MKYLHMATISGERCFNVQENWNNCVYHVAEFRSCRMRSGMVISRTKYITIIKISFPMHVQRLFFCCSKFNYSLSIRISCDCESSLHKFFFPLKSISISPQNIVTEFLTLRSRLHHTRVFRNERGRTKFVNLRDVF